MIRPSVYCHSNLRVPLDIALSDSAFWPEFPVSLRRTFPCNLRTRLNAKSYDELRFLNGNCGTCMRERERYFREFAKKDFLHDSACIMSAISIQICFLFEIKLSCTSIMSLLYKFVHTTETEFFFKFISFNKFALTILYILLLHNYVIAKDSKFYFKLWWIIYWFFNMIWKRKSILFLSLFSFPLSIFFLNNYSTH